MNIFSYYYFFLFWYNIIFIIIKKLLDDKSKISATDIIKLIPYPTLIIIIIIIIVDQSLLINQDKLSCDSSYVCLDNDSKTNTNNGTIKFSAVISIILSCLILIVSLILLSQN